MKKIENKKINIAYISRVSIILPPVMVHTGVIQTRVGISVLSTLKTVHGRAVVIIVYRAHIIILYISSS